MSPIAIDSPPTPASVASRPYGAAGIEPASDHPPIDVWSRWGSKYRVRAVVLLLVNILLFAGVGSFAYWLRTGLLFSLSRSDYWGEIAHTFHGVGQADVSLGSFLVQPISVQNVPMQIPIVALLMAALISIPILVAILYRFWSSLPFIAIVGFLAVMPWLAVTLLGSCILASVKPFRTRYRFMSALIGLVPAILYLILAWAGTADALRGQVDPIDQIKFIAPWILAIVASTLGFVIVLAIAKWVNYRPGALTPLLAVMFGLPVIWFEVYVGRDELYYRLLERMDQDYFRDCNAEDEWLRSAERTWEQIPPPRPSWESVREQEQSKWLFELTSDLALRESELAKHQLDVAERCNRFLRSFPTSIYAANAVFIRSRAFDRRVDLREFRASKWIRFYDDFPSTQSRYGWNVVRENRPDSAPAAVALLRLAQLEAREGSIDRAITYLSTLLAKFDSGSYMAPASLKDPTSLSSVLAKEMPEASLRIPLEGIVLEAHRLHSLFTLNKDPVYRYDPITGRRAKDGTSLPGLADLDPRHERYIENLEALKRRYPRCQIEDNIDLEIAKATASPEERLRKLEAVVERFFDRDALPEALLRLGLAQLELGDAQKCADSIARLQAEFPDSIWSRQAIPLGHQVSPLHASAVP